MLESETWQPGKVISNKIKTNHTYLATTNYWAPLHETEEDDNIEEIKQIKTVQPITNTNSNKLTRRIERRRMMKLVIDSGATSNFAKEKEIKQGSILTGQHQILPGLKTPLVSVNKTAEEGYITVFHPGEEGYNLNSND